MHLVTGLESYKIAFGIVTNALWRINEIVVKVGEILCLMTFMIVDIDSYDLQLGLDFLIKIGIIVEKRTIQIKQGSRNNI
jgi:hypothetical protein